MQMVWQTVDPDWTATQSDLGLCYLLRPVFPYLECLQLVLWRDMKIFIFIPELLLAHGVVFFCCCFCDLYCSLLFRSSCCICNTVEN